MNWSQAGLDNSVGGWIAAAVGMIIIPSHRLYIFARAVATFPQYVEEVEVCKDPSGDALVINN